MKGLKHLKNYVVADRDYKKIAIALPFIGLFGLFFSVVLFPIVGFHVVKWVSTRRGVIQRMQLPLIIICHVFVVCAAISTDSMESVATNVHPNTISDDFQNLSVQCAQQARRADG